MVKTNAARVLDKLKIEYELREYEVDPNDLSAETVATKIGLPPEQIFKTLVVRGDRYGIYLAVIPSNRELDFKAFARQTRDRKIDMVPFERSANDNGLHSRGSYRSRMQEDYPVYIDTLAQICDAISVSAGIRGLQILLDPEDHIRAVSARVVGISK